MSEKLTRAKQHVQDHKELYIGVAVGVAIASVAGTIAFRKTIIQNIESGGFVVSGALNRVNATTINLIENSTPSKPVRLVAENRYFSSIREAARLTGHSASMISRNVNGIINDVKGDVFELVPIDVPV